MTPLCESYCKSHEYVEKTMSRLEDISDKLVQGQIEIISLIKDVSQLGRRIQDLEERQDEIRKWMLKMAGAIAFAGFLLPVFVTFVLR